MRLRGSRSWRVLPFRPQASVRRGTFTSGSGFTCAAVKIGSEPVAKDLDPSTSMADLFATRLKLLRRKAGWTQEEVGRRVHVVASRIAQLERATGHKPTLELTRALDKALGAERLLIDLLPHVLREAFPDWARRFLELAEGAVVICEYSSQLVPGLLQTEDYARAVMALSRTLTGPEHLEERVSGRLSRQERLNGPNPPELWMIIEEAVLLRPVGDDDEVMREQLTHLLRVASAPNMTLQVLPFTSGQHGLGGGGFSVLTMPDGSKAAHVEGLDVGWLTEEPDEVASYARVYDRLRAHALSPRTSARRIRSVLEKDYGDTRVPSRLERRRLAQVQLHQSGRQLRRGGRRLPRPDARP